jgi:hypothetical protein
MPGPQRIASQPNVTHFYMDKVVPCISIKEFPDKKLTMLTITVLVIDSYDESNDRVITTEQFLDLVNKPIEGVPVPVEPDGGTTKENLWKSYAKNNESYDNLVIKYEDFPGNWTKEIFKKLDVYLRVKTKLTIPKTLISPYRPPGSKNTCVYIKYIDAYKPGFGKAPELVTSNKKVFVSSNISDFEMFMTADMMPSLIMKIDGPNIPYSSLDFILLHSEPGYYSNVDFTSEDFMNMKNNNYNEIVVDSSVIDNIEYCIQNRVPIAAKT